mgnify:CR=1 FL=1
MSVPEPTIQIVDDDELFLACDLAAAAGQRVRGQDVFVGERPARRSAMRTRRAVSWPICRCQE